METEQILKYIRQTADAEPQDLIPISGGLSATEKYRVTIGGQKWMAKITAGSAKREAWYRKLSERSNDQLATPRMHKLFDDGNMCLLSPWIEGESLEEKLKDTTHCKLIDYAVQSANILLHLHKESFEYPDYSQLLTNRILSACAQVDKLGLTFPGHRECCSFLLDAAKTHKAEHICFVHQDIRPENFIVNGERLVLIDFENGSLGERAADFAYLTTMGNPEHRAFARVLIDSYLQSVDSRSFWQDNLLYSALQVVEYAVWKWQNKGRQMHLQAENMMRQYDNLKSVQPRWWKDN